MHSQWYNPISKDVRYSESDDVPILEDDQFVFHYNSDLSGRVSITHWRESTNLGKVEIPGWMLLEFVGRHVNSELVEEIQNMSGRETLVTFQRMLA